MKNIYMSKNKFTIKKNKKNVHKHSYNKKYPPKKIGGMESTKPKTQKKKPKLVIVDVLPPRGKPLMNRVTAKKYELGNKARENMAAFKNTKKKMPITLEEEINISPIIENKE